MVGRISTLSHKLAILRGSELCQLYKLSMCGPSEHLYTRPYMIIVFNVLNLDFTFMVQTLDFSYIYGHFASGWEFS